MSAFSPSTSDLWLSAGWTMFHYIWLGTVVALFAFMSKCALRRAPSDVRYGVAFCWLALLAVAPVGIGVWASTSHVEEEAIASPNYHHLSSVSPPLPESSALDVESREGFASPDVVSAVGRTPSGSTRRAVAAGPDSLTVGDDVPRSSVVSTGSFLSAERPPLTVGAACRAVVSLLPWIWIIGAPLTFGWSVVGLAGAERLRSLSAPASDQALVGLCRRLAGSLRISRTVAVHLCERIGSPILVGIVRPAVLLPPALVSGLSPEQLEMVLLHELAHVRRWDNLVNLLQRVVESLLFFHPAVWLVSRWVRVEREHCCDDMVMSRLGDRDGYAEALLAALRERPWRTDTGLAVAAGAPAAFSAGAEDHLRLRIRRILTSEVETMQVSRKLTAAILLALAATFLGVGSWGLSRGRAQATNPTSKSAGPSQPGVETLKKLIGEGHKREITNSIGMRLRLIPSGSFMMGEKGSQHEVTITKPYYIGAYEVTQDQYEKVMEVNPGQRVGPNLPVGNVSWHDAAEFCRKLSEKESATYRLPTEAEWEYACRAGTTTKYYWGDEYDQRYCWDGPKLRWYTKEVGGRLPNAWGLYDMNGNVWEWCEGRYARPPAGEKTGIPEGATSPAPGDPEYAPGETEEAATRGPSRDDYRVLRGGSCRDGPKWWRSAAREAALPDFKWYAVGFRVLKEIPGSRAPNAEKNHAKNGREPAIATASHPEGTGNLWVRVSGEGIKAHWGVHAYSAREGPDGKNRIEASRGELNRYAFKGLNEGEYVVRAPIPFEIAGANGKATVQLSGWARATVKPGEDTRVEIAFQEDATIRGAFRCPDKNLSWRIILLDGPDKSRGDSSVDISRARALAWNLERTGHYQIKYLSPGTYTIIGRVCRQGENWTPFMEKKQTVVVGKGKVSVADFDFALQPSDARASAPPSVREEEEDTKHQRDLRAFFDEIDRTYPFFDLKSIGKSWAQTKQRLTLRVEKCESDTEFLRIVLEAIKCLRDSHLRIYDAAEEIPWPKPEYYPGVFFMPAQGNAVVVMRAAPGQERSLPAGTVVKTIDGVDAREYLDARAKQAWQSGGFPSPQRARLFAYRIPLKGAKGSKHKVVVQRQDGEEEIVLHCSAEALGWPHWYNLPANLDRVGRSFFYTKLPTGVGYIWMRRVDSSAAEGISRAVRTYPDARGWIVDLRGNGGGGYGSELIERIKQLPRPVAGLIDAGCMSAGETLARDLRRYAGARLFGSKTAGSSSAKKTWKFPSGIASLTIPTRSRWRADGKPIEYNGIEPDEQIEPVPGDVLKGLNTEILGAEKYILSQPSQRPGPIPSAKESPTGRTDGTTQGEPGRSESGVSISGARSRYRRQSVAKGHSRALSRQG